MNMMDEQWAVVELMGHVKLAGRLSEVERFGSKMGRLDIPNPAAACTGVSASWCPVCGDCTCPEDGDKDSPTCRLHSPESPHAVAPEFVTQFFTGQSVYRITFVTEAVARAVAKKSSSVEPVQPWDFPKQLAAASPPRVADLGDEDDEDFEE